MAAANIPDALQPLPNMERLEELMMDAARMGRDDVIPALLQAGVSINARDPKGFTPLILASYNGQASSTALLLDHGADIDVGDGARGNTALMGVAFKGYGDICSILVARGADVNRRNDVGQTALMMAALFGQTCIVDHLLAAGADPTAIDDAGNSALTLARSQGNAPLADRLAAKAETRGIEQAP